MTPEQDQYLSELTRRLHEAHQGRHPLAPSVLQHAQALIRSADAGRMPLTEAEEGRVDALYGLLKWGELVYPLHRLDPGLFAERRRARRIEGRSYRAVEY